MRTRIALREICGQEFFMFAGSDVLKVATNTDPKNASTSK